MKTHNITRRDALLEAKLQLGSLTLPLDEFATTGIRGTVISTSGGGKTSLALLVGEQLSEQGWISVFVDPEGEIASLYGPAVSDPEELASLLEARSKPIVVVSAADAAEFIPYGEVILAAADEFRKPIYLFIDEGQLFSASRRKKFGDLGQATEIIDDIMQRGRKRLIDTFISTRGYVGTLSRAVFASKTLTLIGRQEDPAAWAALSIQFKGTGVTFKDLTALSSGEFYCFSTRGCEKIKVPMAKELAKVAIAARVARPVLPATYTQWDQAMQTMPTPRLEALDGEVAALLAAVSGISTQQLMAGTRALRDELECRA